MVFLPRSPVEIEGRASNDVTPAPNSAGSIFTLFRSDLFQTNFALIVVVSGASSGVNSALNGMLQDALAPAFVNKGQNATIHQSLAMVSAYSCMEWVSIRVYRLTHACRWM